MNLRDLQGLTAQQWAARANSALPYAVSVGLVIAIAWQLVQVTWLLLDRNRSATPAGVVAQAPRQRQPAPVAIDVQAIANAHIFDVATVTQTMDPMEAPPAQVNLVLAGTMASDPPDQAGFAIIGETPTNAKTYPVGATIQPGIRLHAVYADRAIIDRGGSLETLKLPRQFVGPPPAAAVALAPAAAPAASNFAQNLRRIAETNPSAFSEIVRPQPVFANGSLKGYRVYPGRNRKPFARLGLQPGDLVTSINGTPLDDPARGMEIFNSISSSPRVEVTVERNGQSQQVVLDTAKINLPDTEAAPGRGAASAPASGSVPPASGPPDTSRSLAGIETD